MKTARGERGELVKGSYDADCGQSNIIFISFTNKGPAAMKLRTVRRYFFSAFVPLLAFNDDEATGESAWTDWTSGTAF